MIQSCPSCVQKQSSEMPASHVGAYPCGTMMLVWVTDYKLQTSISLHFTHMYMWPFSRKRGTVWGAGGSTNYTKWNKLETWNPIPTCAYILHFSCIDITQRGVEACELGPAMYITTPKSLTKKSKVNCYNHVPLENKNQWSASTFQWLRDRASFPDLSII